jgi:sugar/nucleoside kinase (ribokinase family)
MTTCSRIFFSYLLRLSVTLVQILFSNSTHSSGGGSLKRSFDITIAGELNLDLVMYGLPDEMPLERELLATAFAATLGSSSAILAHNIAVLGAFVGFSSLIGDDPWGKLATERLLEAGVDASQIRVAVDGTATGVTILLPHRNGRHILTYPGTMATLTLNDLDLGYLSSGRHFHFSSFFLQSALRPDVLSLFRRMRHAGLTISLDTNDDPEDRWEGVFDLLPFVDVLLPNAAEACRMTGCDDLARAVDKLASMVPLVVVKCGADGALVASGSMRASVPGVVVQPVDTIGAGDSFNAGFLAGYLRGLDPHTCAVAANLCAALSTLRPGGTEAFRDAPLRTAFFARNPLPWTEAVR